MKSVRCWLPTTARPSRGCTFHAFFSAMSWLLCCCCRNLQLLQTAKGRSFFYLLPQSLWFRLERIAAKHCAKDSGCILSVKKCWRQWVANWKLVNQTVDETSVSRVVRRLWLVSSRAFKRWRSCRHVVILQSARPICFPPMLQCTRKPRYAVTHAHLFFF